MNNLIQRVSNIQSLCLQAEVRKREEREAAEALRREQELREAKKIGRAHV